MTFFSYNKTTKTFPYHLGTSYVGFIAGGAFIGLAKDFAFFRTTAAF